MTETRPFGCRRRAIISFSTKIPNHSHPNFIIHDSSTETQTAFLKEDSNAPGARPLYIIMVILALGVLLILKTVSI
jgi:hypothetical protein